MYRIMYYNMALVLRYVVINCIVAALFIKLSGYLNFQNLGLPLFCFVMQEKCNNLLQHNLGLSLSIIN